MTESAHKSDFNVLKATVAVLIMLVGGMFSTVGAQSFECGNYGITSKGDHILSSKATSDTIDVLHYSVFLDFTQFAAKNLVANCEVTFRTKQPGVGILPLDLLKMNVDSVKQGVTQLSFTHDDTLLVVTLPAAMNQGDTASVTVYYQGTPIMDASGWGGFYYSGNYAYNLGVGFQADPHSYGRVWHPCLDNFVEKATYEFGVVTDGGRQAHCNGTLVLDSVISNDTIYRKWVLRDPISSYLACVAVSDYETVFQQHAGLLGAIPIELAARATDTTNVKNSFANLGKAIDAFEKWYGPHRFEKVGYSFVPFNAGAMEHATNIAYPRSAANGSLNSEDLMAHELSHHWWGDNATCEDAKEMWINEGWARYSEHLFMEEIYGKNAYNNAVRNNFLPVIQDAHFQEDSFQALANIPHDYTYGSHTYNKGGAVVHNLRTYLGDSLFTVACHAIMDTFNFANVSSTQMMNTMSNATGYNLQDFYNGWVFAGGYPFFGVDSMTVVTGSPNNTVTVYLKQKLRGAPALFGNVPMMISLKDYNWNRQDEMVQINGATSSFTFQCPFVPTMAQLNEDIGLNHAMTHNTWKVRNTVTLNGIQSKCRVLPTSIVDSIQMRVEHNWVAPDPIVNNPNGYKLSVNHFWRLQGDMSKITGGIRFTFNGTSSNGYLDEDLVKNTEDSIILLYRKDAGQDWTEFPYYIRNHLGSSNNQNGFLETDSLIAGDYSFANGPSTIVSTRRNVPSLETSIYPNPTEGRITIKVAKTIVDRGGRYEIFDLQGKQVSAGKVKVNTSVAMDSLPSGTYIVRVKDNVRTYRTEKIVKK